MPPRVKNAATPLGECLNPVITARWVNGVDCTATELPESKMGQMSERYTIQELGGAELARHYPDKGPLLDSNWYNGIARTKTLETGFLGWLKSLKHACGFWAVLSADPDGFRMVVASDEFAIFIPWSEATVSALRDSPATVVCLRTAAVPSLELVISLDDVAADDLFQKVIVALPRRNPPLRLLWWLDYPWQAAALLVSSLIASALITKFIMHLN